LKPLDSRRFLLCCPHERRAGFLHPWKVVETPGGYRVDDATGQTIGWWYGEDEPSRRTAMRG
jgi:hypothetical protein